MTQIGMDTDAVRGIASKIDTEAARLQSVVSSVDSLMDQIQQVWKGATSQRHVGWWHDQHRPNLVKAQHDIAGLAASARNNAREQDQASGSGRGSAGSASVDGGGGASWGALGGAGAIGTAAFFASTHTASVSGSSFSGERGELAGSTTIGSVGLRGSISGYAGDGAEGEAHASYGPDGLAAGVSGRVYEGVGVAAAGSVAYGIAFANASGSAFIGQELSGEAGLKLGADGLVADAGAKYFKGAEASAQGSVDLGGAGVSGGVSGYAGFGIEASAKSMVTAHDIKVQADLGIAVGLGGAAKVGFEVHPDQVAQNLSCAALKFFHL